MSMCFRSKFVQSIISAVNCSTLNSTWENIVTEPPLPVPHGATLTLNCVYDSTNRESYRATCQDGQVVPTTNPPDCRGEEGNESKFV